MQGEQVGTPPKLPGSLNHRLGGKPWLVYLQYGERNRHPPRFVVEKVTLGHPILTLPFCVVWGSAFAGNPNQIVCFFLHWLLRDFTPFLRQTFQTPEHLQTTQRDSASTPRLRYTNSITGSSRGTFPILSRAPSFQETIKNAGKRCPKAPASQMWEETPTE